MKRTELLGTIKQYRNLWLDGGVRHDSFDRPEEEAILSTFLGFIDRHSDCFERSLAEGHVTGSALVVTPSLDQVLLTLHGKLGIWLQLGGHADGNHRVHEVAFREVEEESGLREIRFLPYETLLAGAPSPVPLPFDFDYHHIPARPSEPAHIHYDVRYVIVADLPEPLVISDESKDLRWFSIDEARGVTNERSMHRQFDKLSWLRQRLTGPRPTLG